MQSFRETLNQATFREPDFRIRFAILLKPDQDRVAMLNQIAQALQAIDPDATVRFSAPQETRVLIAVFPGRGFLTASEGPVFAAAYALAAALDVDQVEPDLATAFFPQPPQTPPPGAPHVEGLGEFPPGCWAPHEAHLEDRPRWALENTRVLEAWRYSQQMQRPDRGAGIVIAQPDTGITDHTELRNVVLSNPVNILQGTLDPTDPLTADGLLDNPGHGTGTASVAVSPDVDVVFGSAPRSVHMPIRAIDSVMRISQVSVAAAVDWAVDHGAHVITMSLGGLPSFTLQRAIQRAIGADLIVMAAAGNCVSWVVWPARYDECIAVAGVDSSDKPWKGSCRGASVTVSAPAQNVYRALAGRSEQPGSGQGQGTSFAVALTAGVAALWLAHHGRANLIAAARARGETLQAMFTRLLRATARRPEGWNGFEMGEGIVDALGLLQADLDLGREHESAAAPASSRETATRSIQSLVLDSSQSAEALQEGLDWVRFGPEIASRILTSRLRPKLRWETLDSASGDAQASSELNDAVVSGSLRSLLELPDQQETYHE